MDNCRRKFIYNVKINELKMIIETEKNDFKCTKFDEE